jgi:glycosyltransferase involved in cell wall biosynthesis
MSRLEPDEVRRVLVVAYYFPPMGLSGVQRTLKFVKNLPRYNWHPTVLTVGPVGYFAHDETLLDDLAAPEVRVVRTESAGPGRLLRKRETVRLPSERVRKGLSMLSDTFYIPDNKIGWKRKAVRTAMALHRETPFDLVFATAPPFTDFLIGAEVKRQIGKPLVFDYRDPWLEFPFKFYPTPFHRSANARLEREALRASSHVVTTNRRVKELLIARHGFLTHHDIDIIPQGFDPEDFPPRPPATGPHPSTYRSMRFTYTGIFYEDRVPDHFLRGLRGLFEQRPELRGKIEARFVGNFRKENMRLVEDLGLQDSVVVMDYLPHRKCVKEMVESDVVWIVVGDDLGSPGKVYEYIGARKPILGLVPEGFLRSTIQEAGGVTVGPEDVPAVTAAIGDLYDRFLRNELPVPPEEVVAKYDRTVLTAQLVKVFESLFEP